MNISSFTGGHRAKIELKKCPVGVEIKIAHVIAYVELDTGGNPIMYLATDAKRDDNTHIIHLVSGKVEVL